MAVLELKNVTKNYVDAGRKLEVLRGVNMNIKAGEMVALVGPSGSGKTTLLQIASLLDLPDSGSITIAGEDASQAPEHVRTKMRKNHLGFVYQFHHLLPEFNALENVAMPLLVGGVAEAEAYEKAAILLDEVGLAERGTHLPDQLSGGEQQRVAIARALIGEPKLLIADEPTGNLDPDSANKLFELWLRLVKAKGLSVLMATHNMELAGRLDHKLLLNGGKLA